MTQAGDRTQATQLKFEAGDGAQPQVDVATGNLLVSAKGLALVRAKSEIVTVGQPHRARFGHV